MVLHVSFAFEKLESSMQVCGPENSLALLRDVNGCVRIKAGQEDQATVAQPRDKWPVLSRQLGLSHVLVFTLCGLQIHRQRAARPLSHTRGLAVPAFHLSYCVSK